MRPVSVAAAILTRMRKQPVKQRHHTAPKVYLRGFADSHELVSVRRRNGDELKLHINNVTVRSGFYNVRTSTGVLHDAVENWFMSEVETPAGPVLRRLRDGGATDDLGVENAVVVSHLVAAQLYRTATARSYMEQVDANLGPLLMVIEVTKTLGIDPRRLAPEQLATHMRAARELLREHQAPADVRLSQVRTMVREIDKMMNRLENWHWTVVEAAEPRLITGDAPAVGLQPGLGGFHGILPAGSPVYLPLTPTRLLIGTRKKQSSPINLNSRLAFAVNQRIANESADVIMKATWQDWPPNVRMPATPPQLPTPRISYRPSTATRSTFPATYPTPRSGSVRNLLRTLEASEVVL